MKHKQNLLIPFIFSLTVFVLINQLPNDPFKYTLLLLNFVSIFIYTNIIIKQGMFV
jgi:hypothetical protein